MTQSTLDDYQDSGCIDHTDAETLRRLYWDEGLSLNKIAERSTVTGDSIRRWMQKHDIPRREQSTAAAKNRRVEYAHYTTRKSGYEEWTSWNSVSEKTESVHVHRLVAVAEYGFDAVAGKSVHHENNIPWDNRPRNLKPVEKSEHTEHHQPWKDSPAVP